ncbi:hypothetical protein A2863_02040 [Candidatus Woesebacteria bacterium RIFCSPHIGHO2_01_FULL_38_9b]|uniref:Antitoxin n=1 Tax=Candidatus Woesebacteria bacterium RIFCSPHIGHO2_01_FULL_38_9b TaxID=1802493 RepID=A0A1F7Y527_9BACT|nr:MAG: hypothetical protein A2863_02040 [Candidatus Woesebacteria bacterium RIFCSPHIGHO2_01_FULL_38_9b]
MQKSITKYIDMNPEILGGTPIIKGTRIPLIRLYYLVKQGYSPHDLQKDYPWVDKEKIQMVVAYLMKVGLDAIEKTYSPQASS